jgi:hypothetical protein
MKTKSLRLFALADRSKTAHFPEAETSSDADSRHGRYQ